LLIVWYNGFYIYKEKNIIFKDLYKIHWATIPYIYENLHFGDENANEINYKIQFCHMLFLKVTRI
jgi:hypothetical protein